MSHRNRVILFMAVAVAATLLGGGFLALFRQSYAAGGIEGVIVEKHFQSAPETEITVGSKGLHERQSPGVFLFKVRALSGDKIYQITVDPTTYAAHRKGDKYYFVPLR